MKRQKYSFSFGIYFKGKGIIGSVFSFDFSGLVVEYMNDDTMRQFENLTCNS